MASGPEISSSSWACEGTVSGSGAKERLEGNPNPFFTAPASSSAEWCLPDGVVFDGEHQHRGYLFRHIKRRVYTPRTAKVLEKWYCIRTHLSSDLPEYVLTCRGYGYKSIQAFFGSANAYREHIAELKPLWWKPETCDLDDEPEI